MSSDEGEKEKDDQGSDMDMKSSDDDEVPMAKRLLKSSNSRSTSEGVRYPVEGNYVDQAERDR